MIILTGRNQEKESSEIQKEVGSFHDLDGVVLQLNGFRLVSCDNDEFLRFFEVFDAEFCQTFIFKIDVYDLSP